MPKGNKWDARSYKQTYNTKKRGKKREEIVLKDHYILPNDDNFCKIVSQEEGFNGFLNFLKVSIWLGY
jgi:hypothetical protein